MMNRPFLYLPIWFIIGVISNLIESLAATNLKIVEDAADIVAGPRFRHRTSRKRHAWWTADRQRRFMAARNSPPELTASFEKMPEEEWPLEDIDFLHDGPGKTGSGEPIGNQDRGLRTRAKGRCNRCVSTALVPDEHADIDDDRTDREREEGDSDRRESDLPFARCPPGRAAQVRRIVGKRRVSADSRRTRDRVLVDAPAAHFRRLDHDRESTPVKITFRLLSGAFARQDRSASRRSMNPRAENHSFAFSLNRK